MKLRTLAILATSLITATAVTANPFFAFDNGLGNKTPAEQAALLKQLGYDGIGSTGTGHFTERKMAFDEQGLKIFTLYVHAFVDQPNAYEAGHLFYVSINGADQSGGWPELIRPLDEGKFDVPAFLKSLGTVGYKRPIGLQCFQVRGAPEDHLKRSMAKWREIGGVIAKP